MTFRSRLVMAAAVAVVIAVLGACAAAYVASRDSLVESVDGTLRATATALVARQFDHRPAAGLFYEFIDPHGNEVVFPRNGTHATTSTRLPVSAQAKQVAAGKAPSFFTTITLGKNPYRELVVYAGPVRVTTVAGGPPVLTPIGLLVVLPLSGVIHQLHHLRWVLAIIAATGIAVAVLLAWLVGRTALVPLNDLTDSVEDVAATTDVSRRLDPGGPDELGRLRRAFNHLLAALQRSQQAQRQLVLDAGHELRTPLTSLQTNLEVVRRLEELSPEDRAVLVDDLLTQMDELTKLVADLSELARGDMRREEPRPFRLDRVVEDAVGVATAHGRSREVGFRLDAQPTWVRGRRDRVVRAVGNLLDNALKWSTDGGVVEVSCGDGTVSVRDHGPGISAEDLPHIFDRFYRAPGSRRLPGSGLGLAIVAQVAEDEGGSVTAGSAVDGSGGAVFRLSFPAVAAPPPGWSPADGSEDEDEDEDADEDAEAAEGEQAAERPDERDRHPSDDHDRTAGERSDQPPSNGTATGDRTLGRGLPRA